MNTKRRYFRGQTLNDLLKRKVGFSILSKEQKLLFLKLAQIGNNRNWKNFIKKIDIETFRFITNLNCRIL